jgi:hypothetical protein
MALRTISDLTSGLKVGEEAGLGYPVIGVITWIAFFVAAALASCWKRGTRFIGIVANSRWTAIVILLFLSYEVVTLTLQFAEQKSTLHEQQQALTTLVPAGEAVLGDVAATVFMPHRVETLRRENAPPALNEDVVQRRKPGFLIEHAWRDWKPVAPRPFQDLIDTAQTTPISEFEIGPYKDGVPRHVFHLYRLRSH